MPWRSWISSTISIWVPPKQYLPIYRALPICRTSHFITLKAMVSDLTIQEANQYHFLKSNNLREWMVQYSLMSSANISNLLETSERNSLMYKANNRGPSMDPCGTPETANPFSWWQWTVNSDTLISYSGPSILTEMKLFVTIKTNVLLVSL